MSEKQPDRQELNRNLAQMLKGGVIMDVTTPEQWFGVLPVTVRRNAYGRQLGSFTTRGMFDGQPDFPMTFIRAPAITEVAPKVEVLSTFDGAPTAVRWRNITAFTWHPELN